MKFSDYLGILVESTDTIPDLVHTPSEHTVSMGSRVLDLTALKSCLASMYAEAGHAGEGFSKLSEEELVTYPVTRRILADALRAAPCNVAVPEEIAGWIYRADWLDYSRG